jgi:diguanylate cyclase (GGDEF)-like protein/PAS domain S-box-containing protein
MMNRAELLDSALDSLPEGIALFDDEGEVVFWNHAAEMITGYAGSDVVGRPVPHGLEPLAPESRYKSIEEAQAGRGVLINARHKLGHQMRTITRALVLRDGLGGRIGMAAVFHPAASVDALPHGATGGDEAVGLSQAELQEHLQAEFEDFAGGGAPFGVLWIVVDQAAELRKTRGVGACEDMIEKVQRAMAQGIRSTELFGRWGDDEFLVVSHEHTPEMLAAHAQVLAGLARTADFRWWGDRISITVSIGAAQASREVDEGLAQLLERAQEAMEASTRVGGNRITPATGGR